MDTGVMQARVSTRTSIAAYLNRQELPFLFTKPALRRAIGSTDENLGRRMRELRELGWVIETYRERPDCLAPAEHLLVMKGTVP